MMQIQIVADNVTLTATLRDTPTAQKILAALPIESRAQTWGEEVYFSVPVTAELESDARDVITAGELAFWVEGSCIAIGFGPTPISVGNEIRLAAKTNIWADCNGDVRQLASVQAGDVIRVKQVK